MSEFDFFLRFLLAIGLGAIIGSERERFGGRAGLFRLFGGLRTFIAITLLGAVSAYLSQIYFDWFIVPVFLSLVVLVSLGYLASIKASKNKDIGLASEFTALLAFFIGILCVGEKPIFAIVLAIIITTLLYLKNHLHRFVRHLSKEEFYSSLVFAIIAFVVLPFLPNNGFGPFGVFNPFIIWLMVVFISGLSFIGYILIKILGPRIGIGLTGFLGGLVSSTAVTTSMASNSKHEKNKRLVKLFVFATIIANAVMFIRVIIEVYLVNPSLVGGLFIPMGVMSIVALLGALFFWRSRKSDIKGGSAELMVSHSTPFALRPALTFGLFFAVVLFLVDFAKTFFGDTGIFVASFVSGFVDVDAITLSVARLAGDTISGKVAITAIILAVISNTAVKLFYASMFGSKKFRNSLGVVFVLVVLSGLLSIWLF